MKLSSTSAEHRTWATLPVQKLFDISFVAGKSAELCSLADATLAQAITPEVRHLAALRLLLWLLLLLLCLCE